VIDQRDLICQQFNCRFVKETRQYYSNDNGLPDVIVECFGNGGHEVENEKKKKAREACASWMFAMEQAEKRYMEMIESGASPQFARGVLPIDVKTEIVMTANLRQWGHVFKMRTDPVAHPNMHQLMIPLLEDFKRLFPGMYENLKGY